MAFPFDPAHSPRMETFNEPSPPQGFPLARDRIAQAYLGLWGSAETREQARRRIDWLASQVTGKRALDVGCSEGILSVLLAREGVEVIGVDVNPDALEYARKLLAQENEFVRQRVTWIHADLEVAHLEPASFDTVILGEVIEHLLHPERMVERSFSFLKPYGTFLLTTPFGWFPVSDHRQAFTLSHVVEILKPYCIPLSIGINDKFICFAGRKQASEPQNWMQYDDAVLLRMVEKAAIEGQQSLRAKIEELSASKQRLKEALHARMSALQARAELLQRTLDTSRNPADALEKEAQGVQKHSEELPDNIDILEDEITFSEAQSTVPGSALERLQEELSAWNALYKGARKELSFHKSRSKRLSTRIGRLERQNTDLENRLRQMHAKCSMLQERLSSAIASRERASINYYIARSRYEYSTKSPIYRLCLSLSKSNKHPLMSPGRLSKLLLECSKSTFDQENPIAGAFPLSFNENTETCIAFTTDRPESVAIHGNSIYFKIPEGKSASLVGRETCDGSRPPESAQLQLTPCTSYRLSGKFERHGGSVSIRILEYDGETCLADFGEPLSPGECTLEWLTHPEHSAFCLAFRLTGKGRLKIGNLTLTEVKSDPSASPPASTSQEAHSATSARREIHKTHGPATTPKSGKNSKPTPVIFIAANGAGLGHLTRCMALAKRLCEQDNRVTVHVASTSAATDIPRRAGYHAHYITPLEGMPDPNKNARMWNLYLTEQLEHLFTSTNPEAVLFDGTHPYSGLTAALRSCHVPNTIWMKRLVWKDRQRFLESFEKEAVFDHVIIPGELVSDREKPHVTHTAVSPIVYLEPDELYSRQEAGSLLNLDNYRTTAYVQLGAGNINNIDDDCARICDLLSGRGIQVVVGESIISNATCIDSTGIVHVIKEYPASKYYNAFDFAILASGYNTTYEVIYHALPSVLIPNMETALDDQEARARCMERIGGGFVLYPHDIDKRLPDLIECMLDKNRYSAMKENLKKARFQNGAVAAADFIHRILVGSET